MSFCTLKLSNFNSCRQSFFSDFFFSKYFFLNSSKENFIFNFIKNCNNKNYFIIINFYNNEHNLEFFKNFIEKENFKKIKSFNFFEIFNQFLKNSFLFKNFIKKYINNETYILYLKTLNDLIIFLEILKKNENILFEIRTSFICNFNKASSLSDMKNFISDKEDALLKLQIKLVLISKRIFSFFFKISKKIIKSFNVFKYKIYVSLFIYKYCLTYKLIKYFKTKNDF